MDGGTLGQKTPLMGLMVTSAASAALGCPSSLAGLAGQACPCWTMEPRLGPGWSGMWDTCMQTEEADAGRWRMEVEVKGDLSQTVGVLFQTWPHLAWPFGLNQPLVSVMVQFICLPTWPGL